MLRLYSLVVSEWIANRDCCLCRGGDAYKVRPSARPPSDALDYIRREVVTVGQQTHSVSRAVDETPHSLRITIFFF